MDSEDMAGMVEENCPFAGRSRMKVRGVGENGRVVVVMEDDPSNLNAFGLVHAGAICGLAETAGGMAIFHHLDQARVVVLNTVFSVRFTAMPRGELRCEAVVIPAEAEELLREFKESGSADKSMYLKVLDSSGKKVAEAQATFRLMPTPEEFKTYFVGNGRDK